MQQDSQDQQANSESTGQETPTITERNEIVPAVERADTPIIITGGSLRIESGVRLLEHQLPNGNWVYLHPEAEKAISRAEIYSHDNTWQRGITGMRRPRFVIHYE